MAWNDKARCQFHQIAFLQFIGQKSGPQFGSLLKLTALCSHSSLYSAINGLDYGLLVSPLLLFVLMCHYVIFNLYLSVGCTV